MVSTNPSKVPYTVGDDGVVTADLSGRAPNKISGTRLASAVGMSPWATPYMLACQLLGVWSEDIGDKPSVKVGQVLESVIIGHLNTLGYNVRTGEELFAPREGDHDSWPSDFDDPIFSGHIDGMTDDAIVEVKTTVNPQDWQDGRIPPQYWLQASLYAVMLGKSRILFPVGFLTPEDLSNPQDWDPAENLYLFEAPVHPDIEAIMDSARSFYTTYTLNGTTPEPATDADWRLAELLKTESGAVPVQGLIADLADLQEQERSIKKQIEDIKERLMLNMRYNETDRLEAYGHAVTLEERSRTSVDTLKLKMSGLFDQYAKTTTYKQLNIRKLKE